MRAARIVGDEAVVIIIEPEELATVADDIGITDYTIIRAELVGLLRKLQEHPERVTELVYQDRRDMPRGEDVEVVEVNWT
jgi:hypothetical protein